MKFKEVVLECWSRCARSLGAGQEMGLNIKERSQGRGNSIDYGQGRNLDSDVPWSQSGQQGMM